MKPTFLADPQAIQKLAGEFRTAAENLQHAIPGFESDVFAVGEAFGLLGACTGAADQYQNLVRHTVTGLNQLAEVLDGDQQGLDFNAAFYRSTDRHNSLLLGGN
ncbi:WXG100 family type VII secretion target [Streptacidiphilus sp. PAMC 29251]